LQYLEMLQKQAVDGCERLSVASSTAILKFNAERIKKSILCDTS